MTEIDWISGRSCKSYFSTFNLGFVQKYFFCYVQYSPSKHLKERFDGKCVCECKYCDTF